MIVVLPKYGTHYDLLPIQTEAEAAGYGLTFERHVPARYTPDAEQDAYVVYWGTLPYEPGFGTRYGVMETGFFHEAAFLDTVGNYQGLSLNTSHGYRAVADFELGGRRSARDIIFGLPSSRQSKYNAVGGDGSRAVDAEIVLALQNPTDRSIFSVTNRRGYIQFVHDCCKYYGSCLFVKMHPWNANEVYDELGAIASRYGCEYGKVPIDSIKGCTFVIAFNSTFAIDCLLRDIPYVQYAMGTFFGAYGISYSAHTFPDTVVRVEDGHKLCDFLIHKFCFHKGMGAALFARMVHHYATSREMFPMTAEFSYAANIPD